MKKLLSTLFFALLTSVSAIYASDTEVDGIWYDFHDSNKTASVTNLGYYGVYSGSVVIPKTVTYNGTTYSVTSIGHAAFAWCESLTSITIPNSVTSIGDEAFGGCRSLTSITIPNSVTSIGDYAFRGCSSSISINVDVNNLNYCSVDGVLFSKDKTTLIQCPSGKQGAYTIPNSVTSIGIGAFWYCSSLTSVTIPESVTSIGEKAFYNCYSLTSITIPNSVTSIGEGTFDGCSSLTSVTIPNSVTSIGNRAFAGCRSLTSVTIGNGVTSIGEKAFYYCESLTSITIPNSVTSIEDEAFDGCESLTSVTIPESVTSIGYSFNGTGIYTNAANWENGALYINDCLIEVKGGVWEISPSKLALALSLMVLSLIALN